MRYTDRTGDGSNDAPYSPTTYAPRRPWHIIVPVGIALGLVILAVIGFGLRQANALPAWVPVIGTDSGLAACEAIAKTAAQGSGEASPIEGLDDKAALRKVFSGSRYPEIRDPGTRFVDLVLQLDGMRDDEALAALPLVGPLTESYAALAGGCAEHGYELPSLFGK